MSTFFQPFENGLLTIPTPHVSHTEHALTLWNCQDFSSAVHNFLGHTDLILDFCWRQPSASESRDFVQILSLSKDHTVRVWTLDSRTQQVRSVAYISDYRLNHILHSSYAINAGKHPTFP